MPETMLFGSAFSVVLPPGASDVSKIRPIPDNQEVFVHPVTDQSIIIEILEAVDLQEPDEIAIKTHFDDISTANGAADANILHTEMIPSDKIAIKRVDSCWYILGEQSVSKFNEAVQNKINLHLGLFRIREFSSDILITFNDPVEIHMASSSHQAVPTSTSPWTPEDFKRLLCSLNLLDFNIFGNT